MSAVAYRSWAVAFSSPRTFCHFQATQMNAEPLALLSEIRDDPFIPLLHSYSKEDTTEAAHKARDLLEELRSDGHELTVKHFTIVMDAFGRIGETEHAEQVYESMSVMPNRVTRNVLLLAHVRAGNTVRAEYWLRKMGNEATIADYNILLSAYAREGKCHSAEQLIKVMVDRCETSEPGKCPCEPNLLSYNYLLEAHAKMEGSSERSMEILKVMEHQGKVDARTFAAVVQCLLYDKRPEVAMIQAETFFRIAKEKGLSREMDRLQTSLLDAYVAVAESSSSVAKRTKLADKSHALVAEMKEKGTANVISYNKLLKAWKLVRTADSVARAEAILTQMREQNVADRVSYTTVIGILANAGDEKSAQKANELLDLMIQSGCEPNTQTYNNLILAWVRSGNTDRAEQVLDAMEMAETPSMVPTVVTYSTIMDGWCKSKEEYAATKCEAIFKRMQHSYLAGNISARPNLISYVTLINAHAGSSEKGSAKKAQDVLFEVFDEYKRGSTGLKPNAQMVSIVVEAWQKSGERDAGEHAEALLNWIIATYEDLQDESFRPNEYIFSSTISAWSKSRKVGKMIRARQVLNKMIKLKEQGVVTASPNTHCYTAVINS